MEETFNIADGPNINKAIWRKFQELLQERNYKGLLDFISCTLHTAHNAFRKGISSHQFGEVVEQLAFDLHGWLRVILVRSYLCQNYSLSVIVKFSPFSLSTFYCEEVKL